MTAPLGTNREDHRSLGILDALSTVLVRKHEVIAVIVKPYDGSDVQVRASMVQPSNESLLQSGANSDSQSFMRQMLSNFTVAMNTCYGSIYNNKDSQAHFHVLKIMKIRFLSILLQLSNQE